MSIQFWENVSDWLGELTNVKIKLTICDILFGIVESNHCSSIEYATNFLILLGKWYLNNKKVCKEDIIFANFKQLINNKLETLRMVYAMNDNFNDFLNIYGILYT